MEFQIDMNFIYFVNYLEYKLNYILSLVLIICNISFKRSIGNNKLLLGNTIPQFRMSTMSLSYMSRWTK